LHVVCRDQGSNPEHSTSPQLIMWTLATRLLDKKKLVLKYEKSNLIQIQTKDNFVLLTHKINTLIVLIIFLKKCEKCKGCLHIGQRDINDSYKFICYFEYV